VPGDVAQPVASLEHAPDFGQGYLDGPDLVGDRPPRPVLLSLTIASNLWVVR
jgi:hypothetical protein